MSSGNNLYGALAYNQVKLDNHLAKVIFAHRMIEPQSGVFDINTCLRSFEPCLLANRNTEKPALHVSLNPDPKDVLTDRQLSDIAQEYMQKMGYGDQPFIVYKHEDIGRKHLHIVSLRVDENGRKIDDRFEHRRSMEACRNLERKYGLIPAGQKKRLEGFLPKPVRYREGDIKQQAANVIRPLARDYHFLSLKEYKALLSLYNIGMEEIRGEEKGKPYRGILYTVLDEQDKKTGNPFKSSLFGKSAGIDALEKRIRQSAEIIKNKGLKERSRKVIAEAMQNCNNRPDFEKALEKQGISAALRTNGEGRIYGATFIDHIQKCVFNGSRLGKEFSANVFNDRFTGREQTPEQPHKDIPPLHPSQKHDRTYEEHTDFGGIFDFFPPAGSANDDIEEQMFTRRLNKKGKRNRRIRR
ncbi:MAG: relaxase/mobilization nuclease domain-containing protein [Bacteroidales bacterium]|nr:relaxase/mobilization nuclease domain-containing protein [Bacteroidales bacterium]